MRTPRQLSRPCRVDFDAFRPKVARGHNQKGNEPAFGAPAGRSHTCAHGARMSQRQTLSIEHFTIPRTDPIREGEAPAEPRSGQNWNRTAPQERRPPI